MAHIERILIVGGGIAGLTLATALHQYGFRAKLVEKTVGNLWVFFLVKATTNRFTCYYLSLTTLV